MAYPSSLLKPWRAYGALRDQLGSVRDVYLAPDRIVRRDDPDGGREVVVLLHGFFQTRNVWEVMEDRLRHDGYSVLSFNLSGLLWKFNTHPVDRSARLIADKLARLSEQHGFSRVHVVGHSKGGLIARRYVQHYGGDQRVKSLVTLGTPHRGTPTAAIGVALMGLATAATSACDLLPGSRLVKAITDAAFPAHIPLTSVFSREDLVCPHWSSRLAPRPGEHTHMENVEVRGRGHSELTWDPGVYKIVRQRLQTARALWQEREAR